ncbi:MAG: protein translocase subunit SecD [Planctomycetes bacterium]|nr:protein translocase subunit SecD [Planctomycetota bacterium]
MRKVGWKIALILFVLAMCTWSIMLKEIRLGKDLRGGVSLIYPVHIPENVADPQRMLMQVITVLQDRINPDGIMDISMQPLGQDRIEVVMPLPNQKIRELKAEYRKALNTLLEKAQIRRSDLVNALIANLAVKQFGGENEKLGIIQNLQDAYNLEVNARDALTKAETSGVSEEALFPLQQAVADTGAEYDKLFADALQLNLEESRIARALRLSKDNQRAVDIEGDQLEDPDTGELMWIDSPRDIELLNIRGEFPHLVPLLNNVVTAYDEFASKRKGFDDAEDLMRLLRGAGVLEFHIAVQARPRPSDVNPDIMRDLLAERGPENTDSLVAKWYPINDLKQWYKKPGELAALQADPIGYFSNQNLQGAEYGGEYFLLVYYTDAQSIVHSESQKWSVVDTGAAIDSFGRPAVSFRLDAVGGNLMRKLTTNNVGKPMAILLDGQVYSAPIIREALGTTVSISGNFSEQELNYLTRVLAAGSLEVTLGSDPIAINTMGPSIGEDNLKRGKSAFIIAIIAVMLFMLFYYFFAGVVAGIALMTNGLIIFGTMSLIDGTFTLPGLAGIVLTIGMAVDANVLIYERIREEIFAGEVDLRIAIRLGYQKALSTILDANVTNLIICVVLYYFATTEVKGFALTLGIGIVATLITALFVTRVIYELYTDIFGFKRLNMLPTVFPAIHRMLAPNIGWMGMRKVFWTFSILAVIGSISLVSIRGIEMFDTEFRGGVAATMLTVPIDADGDGQPDKIEGASDVTRLMLPHTGIEGVEQRIHHLAEKYNKNSAEFDPQANSRFRNALAASGSDLNEQTVDMIIREFAIASVLTVGETENRDGVVYASGFQVKVPNAKGLPEEKTISDVIIAAVVTEFGSELDVTPPLDFDGAGSTDHRPYTHPVEHSALGDNIGMPRFSARVTDFIGGVAVVIDNIEPAVSPEEIDKRIDRMRQQEDFARLLGRKSKTFGLDLVNPDDPSEGYSSVAVLVYSASLRYDRVDFDIWNRELAKTEWEIISQALQRQTSLEQTTTFSPAIAESLKDKAIVAVGLSLLGILVYIWFRFGSLRYSLAALVALVHDVSLALGLLAATAWIGGTALGSMLLIEEFRIDLGVVAALLTIIGYSLNDTIVILDRIRENRGKLPIPTAAIVNKSINQTISRTVLTSVTTLLAVGIMYGAGGSGIRPFTFCLLVGLFVGTYSSVAIAAPLVFKSDDSDSLSSEESQSVVS